MGLDGKGGSGGASYGRALSARAEREASTPAHLVSEPNEGAAGGEVHSLASRPPGSPAGTWRTTCEGHFARRCSNWRLAALPSISAPSFRARPLRAVLFSH